MTGCLTAGAKNRAGIDVTWVAVRPFTRPVRGHFARYPPSNSMRLSNVAGRTSKTCERRLAFGLARRGDYNCDMLTLLPSLSTQLPELVQSARHELLISSPYVGREGTDLVFRNLSNTFRLGGQLQFLTDLSPLNVCQSSTDASALLNLSSQLTNSTVTHLPRLHAKVYVADNHSAIITSANLSRGGLFRNYEYGIEVRDPAAVGRIRSDIVAYGALGAVVQLPALENYCRVVDDLRREYEDLAAKTTKRMRARLRVATDELVRMRLHGGAMHTVFARTIDYLLRRHGPMSTESLHPQIAQIHPELCDDTVDRVIDGRRFGKKWKHAVRTAQQQLKKRGVIDHDGNLWFIVSASSKG
jgi:phosphatidylserine/phosphatidylglycerophosphate/cardiolipin synthase-like enzyme